MKNQMVDIPVYVMDFYSRLKYRVDGPMMFVSGRNM